MASLDGLPPLPKSLSGLSLVDHHVFPSGSLYSVPPDKNVPGCENNLGKNFQLSSDNGSFLPNSLRSYAVTSAVPGEMIVSRTRSTPPLRDMTQSLSFKQLSDPPSVGSARASPVINSTRTTPLNSARASPIGTRCSTSPVSGYRGSTPPGVRGLPPPPPPPRQYHCGLQNGYEKAAGGQPRPGRIFNLDTQLASLRKEMMDLSLLNQLWSLNEAIQEFQRIQEESAALSPPSPQSCDESDEFYSPLSSRGYQNISRLQVTSFSGRIDTSSSSSDASVEFGDV